MSNEVRAVESALFISVTYFGKKKRRKEVHKEGIAVHGLKAQIARLLGFEPRDLTKEEYDQVHEKWQEHNDRHLPASF